MSNRRVSRYFDPIEFVEENQAVSNISLICIDNYKKSDKKRNFECPICYENCYTKEAITTQCNHSYCATCFMSIMKTAHADNRELSCALCRSICTLIETSSENIFDTVSKKIETLENEPNKENDAHLIVRNNDDHMNLPFDLYELEMMDEWTV
jgi:hypothetical protein